MKEKVVQLFVCTENKPSDNYEQRSIRKLKENENIKIIFARLVIGTVLAVVLLPKVAARNLRLLEPVHIQWRNRPVKYIRHSHALFRTDTLGHCFQI
jgi:hypothetical protein